MNKPLPMGDPSYMEVSLTEVRDALGFTPKRILDFGYGWGESSRLWLKWFPKASVTCCDPLPQGEFAGVDPVAKLSAETLKRWTFINEPVEVVLTTNIEPFDLIFNDADHEYGTTMEQFYLSWKKLLPGGVMCGHDYMLTGVRRAVNKFSRQTGLQYRLFDHDMRCWMFESKDGE